MEANRPIVQFTDFSFKYRAQAEPTLVGINLTIYEGEKILIAGPSGSGKSTLANCINGLIPFNYTGELSGTCLVDGADVSEQSIFELSKTVGTVLQDTDGQFVGLTVGEDIAFSLENNIIALDEMRERVDRAAELTGMGDALLSASPFDLSGGQKQRASMSGVLVEHPKILVFDEPLASLDPKTGKQAIELIEQIMRQTNTTVIIIEHRIEDVLHRPVDRVVLMNDGRILADLPPTELLTSDLLPRTGLREPLYICALKFAGVEISRQMKAEHIDTLELDSSQKEAVLAWHTAAQPPHAEPPQTVLCVQELGFSYSLAHAPALVDINFDISRGEMVAIVGENGAGKSTLAKLLCGFETPDAGHISLYGKPLDDVSIADRAKHVGYVMQNPNQMIVKPFVHEEVAFALENRNMPPDEIRSRVEDALKICGLHQFRNWPISALSYGQKKRVTIASVLVMQPEVLILDEPTAGQDFFHYTEIMEFLRGLLGSGLSTLLITHDMHLMLEYAPRAIVLMGGRLLADMPSAKLLSDASLSNAASLRETSLAQLARKVGISDASAFANTFVNHERQAGKKGGHNAK